MRPLVLGVLTSCIIQLSTGQAALARKVEHWPYQRLFAEADLVVIAQAVSSAPSDEPWGEEASGWQVKFQAVHTKFSVMTVLKGQPCKSVQLVHFQYPANIKLALENGPQFATFLNPATPIRLRVERVPAQPRQNTKQQQLRSLPQKQVSLQIPPNYLLFLKSRTDGRFEPVSGQIDSRLSVRDLWRNGVLKASNDHR